MRQQETHRDYLGIVAYALVYAGLVVLACWVHAIVSQGVGT